MMCIMGNIDLWIYYYSVCRPVDRWISSSLETSEKWTETNTREEASTLGHRLGLAGEEGRHPVDDC